MLRVCYAETASVEFKLIRPFWLAAVVRVGRMITDNETVF